MLWRARVLTVMLVALCAGRARAGNDDQLPVGGEAAVYGGAVIATVSDGAAGYQNPAGLAQSQRNQLDASITAVGLRFYHVPELLRSASGEAAGATLMELAMVPTAATFTRRLNEHVVASFGIFSPRTQFLIMQQRLKLADPTPQGTNWNLAVNSIVFTYLIGPSIAWQPNRRFSVGASLHVLYNFEDTSAQASGGEGYGGEVPPQQPFVGKSQLFVRTTYGFQLGWGFQWQVNDAYRIGFQLQTPGMQVLSWRQTSETFGVSLPSTSLGPSSSHALSTADGFRAKFQAVLPLRAGLGVARYFPWGRVELDAALQSALPPNDLGVARHALVNGRVGASYKVSQSLSVGGGLFTDLSGAEASAFGLTSVNMFGGSIGMASGTERRLAPGEAAPSLIFGSTLALRYAYGKGSFGGLEVYPIAQGSPIVRNVKTDMSIHELMLSFGSALNF
jgi:long-subunit fatty acid transport protein